jgi:hypothetical protein
MSVMLRQIQQYVPYFDFRVNVRTGLSFIRNLPIQTITVAMPLSKEQRAEALRWYEDGRLPVRAVVDSFRGYPGRRYRHAMWDRRFAFCFRDCLEHDDLSEAKMTELLRAVIAETPDFPLIRSPRDDRGNRNTFLSVALTRARGRGLMGRNPNEGGTSYGVLRLLMVPGITRMYSEGRYTPLHLACEVPGLDPAVVNHLIDLDPGALLLRSENAKLPLHAALLNAWTPASSAIVRRMVELAPDALFRPSGTVAGTPGLAPIVFAMNCRALHPGLARLLQGLVETHPGAVQPGVVTGVGTALRIACRNAYHDAGLIGAIVRTHPPALCIARNALRWGDIRLPFEVAAEREDAVNGAPALEYLHKETVEMALAAVECVLHSAITSSFAGGGAAVATGVAPAAPAPDDAQESSSSSSSRDGSDDEGWDDDGEGDEEGEDEDEAADDDDDDGHHHHDHRIDHDHDRHSADEEDDLGTRVEKFQLRVLAAVSNAVLPSEESTTAATARSASGMSGFAWARALREHGNCRDVCRELFVCPITSGLVLEDAEFREAVLGTTAANLYRLNQVGGRASPSPRHQVRLLALVSDDLGSVYIQFREFGFVRLVPPTGRRVQRPLLPSRKRKAAGFYRERRGWHRR